MLRNSVLAGVVVLAFGGAAFGADVVQDITGVTSQAFQGDPTNEVITITGFNVGDTIDSIDWDFILTTITPSWADEPRIGVGDVGAGDVAVLGPFGSATTVTSAPYAGSLALGTGYVMQTTSLSLEFYESGFDDITGADAIYNSGSLTFNVTEVPAPGVLALAGAAGLVSRRRRRA